MDEKIRYSVLAHTSEDYILTYEKYLGDDLVAANNAFDNAILTKDEDDVIKIELIKQTLIREYKTKGDVE